MSSTFTRLYSQACQANDGRPFDRCVEACNAASASMTADMTLPPCSDDDLACQLKKYVINMDLSRCAVDHRAKVYAAQTKQDNLLIYGPTDKTIQPNGTQPVQYGFRAPYANASDVDLTEHEGLQLYKPTGTHHKPGKHKPPQGYYKGKSGWK